MEKRDSRRHRDDLPRWIRAEQIVARVLARLPRSRFLVFNNLGMKYGNIDHLVIRRDRAVFLVETKSHSGTVTSDGRGLKLDGKRFTENPLCQVQRNIRWLRERIGNAGHQKPWVSGILVFPFAKVCVGHPVKRVVVAVPEMLERLLS